jgi:DNA replication protein DnaC
MFRLQAHFSYKASVEQISFTSDRQINKNHVLRLIGEQTIADAILDRIIHDAHRLELKGNSMRKKRINFQSERKK